jgi:hypothetical protein
MNQSRATFSTASPQSAFLFVGDLPAFKESTGDSLSRKDDELSLSLSSKIGAREAARQRWEAFKPLIQRVYVEEDRPYPYLAEILRTNHGFETTYDT